MQGGQSIITITLKTNKMKNHRLLNRTQINVNESQDGKTLEQKIALKLSNKEPMDEGTHDLIYTDRKEGVIASYNPKTDKFELALEATDAISKSITAKRAGNPEIGKPESTEGKDTDKQAST